MRWWQDRQPLVSCIEFTPDGTNLAIGTCSGFALLWNIDEQRMTRFIDCGSDLVYRIEISDDGRWLATLGTATRLTDLHDDRSSSRPSLIYETEQTRRADFSPNSRHLVIADTAENLLCWETENRSLLFAESVSDGKTLDLTINDVQFSPDGRQVITAMGNSKLYRQQWGKNGLGDAQLIGSTLGSANAIRFAGETILASVCERGVLQSWNLQHVGRPAAMSRLAGHSGGAGCLAHAPSANSFVTGGEDGYVRMYEDKPRPQSIVPKFPVTCINVSSTGERFAMGYSNGLVELRSTESAEVVGTWRHETGSVAGIVFAKNQSDLIVAFSDHKIGIWDLPSGRQTFVEVDSRVYRLTGNLPGDEFAVTFWDGTMGTFSSSGQSLATWTINPNEVAVATMLRLRGRIVTCEKGLIRYWGPRGRLIHQTPIDPEIHSLAPHPSGETMIGFGGNGRIAAIDTDSGAMLKQYRGHVGAVTRVTFPVDGRRLLSIGTDSTARVWDYESGLEMLTLDVSPKKYRRVAMSRDSGVIVAVLSDHSVEIIRLDQD
jgi:WD40 repeat protein